MTSQIESKWATESEMLHYRPESPFLETYLAEPEADLPPGTTSEWRPQLETPFLTQYMGEAPVNLEAAQFEAVLQELFDSEFDQSIAELVQEGAAVHEQHLEQTGELAADGTSAAQFLERWLDPLRREAEAMLENVSQAVTERDVTTMTEEEVEQFLENLAPPRTDFASPVFEDFFKKLWRKIKRVARGAVGLVKKGISAVGRILPIGVVLRKIKRLIRPLLRRVILFAINRLPVPLRAPARFLGKRLGILREGEEEAAATQEQPATGELEAIQQEFDVQVATLLLATEENEQELLLAEVLTEEQPAGETPAAELDAARARFVTEFGQLERGQDPAPALENFIPAVMPFVRLGLRIAGRRRVVNFLARYLGRLIAPHVGKESARQLSRALVDVGLRMIGLETPTGGEAEQPAAEAVMATVEDTVRRLTEVSAEALEDPARLEAETQAAFNEAAARHFPPQLLRPDLPELEASDVQATWVMMPRRRYRYKKYTRVFDATITPQVARSLITFGGGRLDGFLRDGMGVTLPARARVHLYEALPGTYLSHIATLERDVPGLGPQTRRAWTQLHPLTPEAAGTLFQQPGLGKAVDARFLQGHDLIAAGQRFYYLEISGARPRVVPSQDGSAVTARPSEVNLTIDLRSGANELQIYAFVSEREAQGLIPKLRAGDVTAALSLVGAVARAGLSSALVGGMRRHVTVLHEAVQQEELAAGSPGVLAKLGSHALKWLATKILDLLWAAIASYFKEKRDEFIRAAENSADGVTIIVRLPNPPVLEVFRMVLRGGSPGLGDLARLASAAAGVPRVQTVPGFQR